MTSRSLSLIIALPLAAACAHSTKSPAADAAPPAPAPAIEAGPAAAPAAERTCASDDQCGAKELCVAQRCVAIAPGLADCRATAHFEFDRADVRPADQATLQRAARCLSALPGDRAQVEGNADERGTEQYNVALGFRRAHAVARYLQDLGVPPRGLSEVSYGEARPLCTDTTESCWATNRRAEVAARTVAAQSASAP